MEEDDNIQLSKFNAGIAQTFRVDKILSLLNSCKLNPLAWNIIENDWNYNIIFRCLDNLYGELEGFLSLEESRELLTIKEKIQKMFQQYPIRERVKNPNYISRVNYDYIQKALEFYERRIKRYGVKYKLLVSFEKRAGRI